MDSRDIPEWFSDTANLYTVPRWSTVPMYRNQSVAEHSYRVAAIAMAICQMLGCEAGVVVQWAILHDAAESTTGDLISPFKQALDLHARVKAEGIACPWTLHRWTNPHSIADYVVSAADRVEAIAWITKWGQPAVKSRYEPITIESRMRRELDALCREDRAPAGLGEAALILLGEMLK